MELDLNHEPLDQSSTSVVEFDSVLEEIESAEVHIQNRIRHLEAITSRARQLQMLPQTHSQIQITNFTGEEGTPDDEEGGEEGREQHHVEEGIVESGKGAKRKSAHLVAKALGMEEMDDGKVEEESTGNFFDCNICLDIARDPVLTCCGHLFCWSCFYQLSYAYSKAKECPVCKGEVTETGIIPIYGNGSAGSDCQLEMKEAGLRVPPRPRAPRVESIRQKFISQGAPSSSVVQRIPRFQLESINATIENNQRSGSHQASRLPMQEDPSFSSFASDLNTAIEAVGRIVQGLESHINRRQMRRSIQLNPHPVNRNSTFSVADTNRSEIHAQEVAAVTNSAALAASVSPLNRNVDNMAVIGSEIQTTDRNVQISPVDPSSSNGRRRNGVSSQPRRRRRRLR